MGRKADLIWRILSLVFYVLLIVLGRLSIKMPNVLVTFAMVSLLILPLLLIFINDSSRKTTARIFYTVSGVFGLVFFYFLAVRGENGRVHSTMLVFSNSIIIVSLLFAMIADVRGSAGRSLDSPSK